MLSLLDNRFLEFFERNELVSYIFTIMEPVATEEKSIYGCHIFSLSLRKANSGAQYNDVTTQYSSLCRPRRKQRQLAYAKPTPLCAT